MSLRSQKAACLRADGNTYRQISETFGVSISVAKKLADAGRAIPEPDETIFPEALCPQSPIQQLPVSKALRAALSELRIDTFAELQSTNLTELWSLLLRYPTIGRKQVEELGQLIRGYEETAARPKRMIESRTSMLKPDFAEDASPNGLRNYLSNGFTAGSCRIEPETAQLVQGICSMEIRVYQSSDFAGVDALWREVFPNDPPWNRAEVAVADKVAFQPNLFFVAVNDREIIGSIMAGYDGHRGWLYSVAVREKDRDGGVGSALVRHAEQALLELGCRKVNIQIRATNKGVVRFYEELGYSVEGHLSMGHRLRPA